MVIIYYYNLYLNLYINHNRFYSGSGKEKAVVEKVAPKGTAVEKVAPKGTAVEKVAPKGTAVEKVAPKGTAVEKVAPKGTAVEKVAPKGTAFNKFKRKETAVEKFKRLTAQSKSDQKATGTARFADYVNTLFLENDFTVFSDNESFKLKDYFDRKLPKKHIKQGKGIDIVREARLQWWETLQNIDLLTTPHLDVIKDKQLHYKKNIILRYITFVMNNGEKITKEFFCRFKDTQSIKSFELKIGFLTKPGAPLNLMNMGSMSKLRKESFTLERKIVRLVIKFADGHEYFVLCYLNAIDDIKSGNLVVKVSNFNVKPGIKIIFFA